uniref:DNA-directed RNA polymerase n=1 Tax=Babesia orientalis TaxID=273649 RepID=A0A0M3TGU7_9APIC|nr:DNA-directed RNA polymerase subunit beta-like subunit [Babesia orientalis]ALE29343.1 DNA-directed RNA polymerase subunit beta-like subunit [Babesia orientalis]
MQQCGYIKLSFSNNLDIAEKLIRFEENEYTFSLVYTSSPYLHKRIRYRPGGMLCEAVFGYRFICKQSKCKKLFFNENRISNTSCYYCGHIMKFNKNRENRYGAIFLNFPICNPLCIQKLSDLSELFKQFTNFKKNNIYYGTHDLALNDGTQNKEIYIGNSCAVFKVFSSFINFVHFFCSSISVFQKTHYEKKISNKKFLENIKTIKDVNSPTFKELFLLLMPVLPINLRENLGKVNGKQIDSKFNYLYRFVLDLNNKILNKDYNFNYNVKYVCLLFFLIKIIITYALLLDVYPDNSNIYVRLQGKYGIFRQKLLGFRVDYSGRTVIVPGSDLPITNVGLPISMIHKHNQPSVSFDIDKNLRVYARKFKTKKLQQYIGQTKPKAEQKFYDMCLFISKMFNNINDNSVIVNRAPTLHKMNTQAFNTVLSEGRAIKFTPICCTGYNADFDGDQMGIFSILFDSVVNEAQLLSRPMVNLYSPTNKKNMFNATQGVLLGNYIITVYNYLNMGLTTVIGNLTTLIELNINTFYINSPLTLRHNKYFYKTTIGRHLLKVNFNSHFNTNKDK